MNLSVDEEQRLNELVQQHLNPPVARGTPVIVACGAFLLLVGAFDLVTSGPGSWLFYLPPVATVGAMFTLVFLARRNRLRLKHLGIVLFALCVTPSIRAALDQIYGAQDAVLFVFSPDYGAWILMIVIGGILLGRRVGYALTALSVVQYVALYLLARAAMADLEWPDHVIATVNDVDSVTGKGVLLVIAAVVSAESGAAVRKVLWTLFEKERARQQQEAARRVAEDASEAKSAFLAQVNHELRTPLNAVVGYSHLLLQEGGLAAEQRDRVAIIADSAGHLLDLINDILDMSRIEASRLDLASEPLRVRDLAADVVKTLDMPARAKGIRLGFEIADTVPEFVCGDPRRLRQVLLNLGGNAIKYTEVGRVVLTVQRLGADAPAALRFALADTGPGIAPEHLPTIFEPFRQVGGEPGFGLGLSISRELVRLMGGELVLETELGRGSTFSFIVRMAQSPVGPERIDQRWATGYEGPTRRVLVADDHSINRRLIRQMLETMGFRVEVVSGGLDAIEAFERSRPDIVLLDLLMGDMSGDEVARRLRGLMGEGGRVPIVAVTANARLLERATGPGHAFDAIVDKPIDGASLQRALGRLLALKWLPAATPESSEGSPAAFLDAVSISPSDLSTLRDFIDRGDPFGLEKAVARLAEQDPSLIALQNRVRALAEEFDDAGLGELVEQLRSTSG